MGLCGSLEMMENFIAYLASNMGIIETMVQNKAIWQVVIDSEKAALDTLKHFYENTDLFLERKNLLLLKESLFSTQALYLKLETLRNTATQNGEA